MADDKIYQNLNETEQSTQIAVGNETTENSKVNKNVTSENIGGG
jgi:hypothetical protein